MAHTTDPPFPLAASTAADVMLRQALNDLCAKLIPEARSVGVCAIVLTGSMARGEATVVHALNRSVLFGDFDIVFVVAARSDARRLTPRCAAMSRALSRSLGLGACAHVDIGCLPLGELRKPPTTIFFTELVQHGKLLWGQSDVLAQMPAIDPAMIPRTDVLTLVHNRTIEHLKYVNVPPSEEGQSFQLYTQCKAYVDAVTALLTINGRYLSQYRSRLTACAGLENGDWPLHFSHAELPPWFDLKLFGDARPFEQRWGGDFGSPAFGSGLRTEQIRVAEMLYDVWRYVAGRVTNSAITDPLNLADRVLRHSNNHAGQWLRGWYRFCRGRVGLPLLRRIAAGPPELLTYLAAVTVSRALPAYRSGDQSELAAWLNLARRYYPLRLRPVTHGPRLWDALQRGLTRLYDRLIMAGKVD